MQLNKAAAVMDYKLVSSYESLRKRLLDPRFADRLEKPLAYWVIASDRRLPLAFMGNTLRELLAVGFDELFSTAGIGERKIRTFLMLLRRAAQSKPIGALPDDGEDIIDKAAQAAQQQPGMIDPNFVSEPLWEQWRGSVCKHGFQQEPLGRFATSLGEMPRVIWYRPLGDYTDLSLAEIRSLKTHGEKRVRAVLEVFGGLHQILVHLEPDSRLAVQIVPRFLVPIESWVVRWLGKVGIPTQQEIRKSLVTPLLAQVRIDAGPHIAKLAQGRLDSESINVRKAAHLLGLTRARIYQLLSEAAEVVNLRWPAGAALVGQLRNKMETAGAGPQELGWLDSAIELLLLRARGEPQSSDGAETSARSGGAAAKGNRVHQAGSQRNGRRVGPNGAPRRRRA